ncbi:hypothetical protein GCM10009665_00760 [Kitasatospora nipponensis]|uniref:DUF4185 domain-containing protein n=1 Tax=Kitasatospora nipponensis TaxID=258049 RepID=A0ABN1VM49_9ACTN
MPTPSGQSGGITRRTLFRTGAGLALGTGLAVGTGLPGATPAFATNGIGQTGAPLCQQPGDSAAAHGLGSGDLGIPYLREHDGSWGYVFGDSFNVAGDYLRSPVMLNQGGFDSSGSAPIAFSWAMPNGNAAPLFDYVSGGDNGFGTESTRIPNDCIEFRGRTYLQYTSVLHGIGPDPLPAGDDGSVMSGVAYSDDGGVTWTDYGYHWDGQYRGVNQSMYGMWSFAGIDPDGWLYIFSKRWNGSHKNTADQGAIQLFRIDPDDFRAGNFGAQQNWTYNGRWYWASDGTPPTPLFGPGNNIGEFSVKRIGDTYCMSYFDATDGALCTRTAPRPDAGWTAPKTQVVNNALWPPSHWGKPQLDNVYGGYIHPGSANAGSLTLIASQWTQQGAYRVLQFDGINP